MRQILIPSLSLPLAFTRSAGLGFQAALCLGEARKGDGAEFVREVLHVSKVLWI